MKIRWTRTAARHLQAIQDHVALDNPAAAGRVTRSIRQHVDLLRRHPHAGRPGRVDGTRELIVRGLPYIAAYAVIEDDVAILAVLHHARRWPSAFDEPTRS